jgi:hypothetical protein
MKKLIPVPVLELNWTDPDPTVLTEFVRTAVRYLKMDQIEKRLHPTGSGNALFYSVLWIRIRKYLGLLDLDPSLFVRIRILLSSSKKRKTLISTVLLLLHDFFYFLKTYLGVPSKSNKQKPRKKTMFCCVLKATDKKSRIWIRICQWNRSANPDP